ncbi:hypothetical protein J1N35_005622 [Gossypium stocksii]|uniref:Uncharacterized protein n=1 Tax=Gossypium stocksii TaxID=47602 RepID=A0A9D4AH99_9ROSI|nr:hypothetical protein J1N35_005622 [Gossypium stocksii]
MLRYQWENAVRFWNLKKGEELSSGQKVGHLQLFDITHRKKDRSSMTTEAVEIMAQAEVQRLRDQMAQMQASTVEQITQLKAEVVAREAARATKATRKYDELQLQLQNMMKMFQQNQSQNPPS